MLERYPRFINWKAVPDPGKKDRKVPFDPARPYDPDDKFNPHDPKNWRTIDQAKATGHRLGYVLAPDDPFFFLDLDDCHNGTDWSAETKAVVAMFPGASMEVSINGRGLHIMGCCDQVRLADRRHKWVSAGGLHFEFYTEKRFIALGHGFQGRFDIDWTDALLRMVPVREVGDGSALPSGPSIDYTGPTDDAELIRRMLNSKGSMAAQFGSKAGVQHLWEAHRYADVMAQAFPSPSGDVYDRSSADAALMAHLAFWTGRDAARMDRLFRMSGLVRQKYIDRQDYRASTIQNAVANCKKVYDLVKVADTLPDADPAAPGGVAGEFLTIPEQQQYFKGCVYVRDQHRILIPGGEMISPAQFKTYYGGKQFAMSADNTGASKNAFEAFTENRAFQFPKVATTIFRPREEPGAIIDNGVNVYFPANVKRVKGDPSLFLDLLYRLLPIESDRNILLAYICSLVQNPGAKFQWAPVLQGVEGNGKTAISYCVAYAVGQKYTHMPAAEDLANPFNSYLQNKLLIIVEEVHLNGRRELLDTLKPLITNERIEIQPKGIDKLMIDNAANWIFNTNHRDAILKTKNDRRYAIFYTAQQSVEDLKRDGLDGDYMPRFWNWLKKENGFQIVADFLSTFAVPAALDPAGMLHRAPETSSTFDAINASLGKAEQEVIEAVEAGDPGFRNGWISTIALDRLMKDKHIRMARFKIGAMLEALGYVSIGRANRVIFEEEMKRPVLYVTRAKFSQSLGVDDYCLAQAYQSSARAPSVVHIPGARAIS